MTISKNRRSQTEQNTLLYRIGQNKAENPRSPTYALPFLADLNKSFVDINRVECCERYNAKLTTKLMANRINANKS